MGECIHLLLYDDVDVTHLPVQVCECEEVCMCVNEGHVCTCVCMHVIRVVQQALKRAWSPRFPW